MKRNILALTFCALLLTFTVTAHSADGPYISGSIGLALQNDTELTDSTVTPLSIDLEYDAGYTIGGAVGQDYGQVRAEVELSYQNSDSDQVTFGGVTVPMDGETSILSVLVNGYFDFENDSPVTPYVSAGLGFANVDIEVAGASDDDSVIAYQVGAGVGYALN